MSAAASIGEKTKTFGLTGAIRYQIRMPAAPRRPSPRARVAVALTTVLLAFAAGCAASPSPPPQLPTATPAAAVHGSAEAITAASTTLAASAPTVAPAVPTPLARQSLDPTAVVVFASSKLGGAFSEIGGAFMLANSAATGVSYKFEDAALLRALIQQGADADVFASTDPREMDALRQANLLDGAPSVLVRNRLVIVLSKSNPQGIQSVKDLANSGARFIIAAPTDPSSVAIGQMFERASADPAYGADFGAKADRNVLARDGDDPFVVSRIIMGEVNAGVVFSSAIDPDQQKQVQIIDVPDAVNTVVEYPIAVVKSGTNARGGQAFVTYVLSPAGQNVFSKWGYMKAP